jgi:hypothetical protein
LHPSQQLVRLKRHHKLYHHSQLRDEHTKAHIFVTITTSYLGFPKFAIIMFHAQANPADFGTTPPNLTGKNQGKDPPSTQPS